MNSFFVKLCKSNTYIALSLIFCYSSAYFSQETIVDLDPDELVVATSTPFSLDVLNDASPEFSFRVQEMSGDTVLGGQPSTYAGYSAILENYNGQPAGSTVGSAFELTVLNEGEFVSPTDEFGMDASYSLGINLLIDVPGIGIFPYVYGNFLGNSNKYLGIRFTSGTNTHYGWVELSVSSACDSIVIHSYGYNETPDEAIDVGVLYVLSMLDDEFKVWSDADYLRIEASPETLGSSFTLFSMQGKEFVSGVLKDPKTEIDINTLKCGVYNVVIDTVAGKVIKRVYIP